MRQIKGLMQLRSIGKRFAPALSACALALVAAFVPTAALAEGAGSVASVDGTEYATFDEAVAAAPDGATVTLLGDATTSGMNLDKNLTVDGGSGRHALAFADKGIALWGRSLTFKNLDVTMTGVGSTPYTAEWNWVSVCASSNSTITLDGATLTMDGTGTAGNTHAIYLTGNDKLNVQSGSALTIRNYPQDALEWDGGNGGYNLNVTGGSKYVSDHNRSGITGTFYATVDASTMQVTNSTGNGSNGTYYTIKNGSDVTFDGNGTWGMSAWRVDMTGGSRLKATNNGYSGVWTRVLNVDATCSVDVEGNGGRAGSAAQNAGIFFQGNGTYKSAIEKGADVTIKNNAGSGIYTKQSVCNLTVGSATITNNGTGANNKSGIGAEMGGGVYNVGTMTLDPSVVIYNNHASVAGDDIYNAEKASIGFGSVGSDWILDDCNDAITGWFNDAADARWNAHDAGALHVEKIEPSSLQGTVALKAAHGLGSLTYAYVGDAPEAAKLPAVQPNLVFGTYDVTSQQGIEGWTFDGWYLDEACSTPAGAQVEVTGDVTLYGKWAKNPEPAPKPSDDGGVTPQKPEAKPASKPTPKAEGKVPATGDTTSSAFALLAIAGAVVAVAGTVLTAKGRK